LENPLPHIDVFDTFLCMTKQSQVIQGENINAAWADESESRIDAFQEGKLTDRPFDDVMKNLNPKILDDGE